MVFEAEPPKTAECFRKLARSEKIKKLENCSMTGAGYHGVTHCVASWFLVIVTVVNFGVLCAIVS